MRRPSLTIIIIFAALLLSGFGEKHKAAAPVDITMDKSFYSRGEIIKLSVKFTNVSDKDISTYFPSSQKFDLVVTDANKKEIWRWSRGKMFTMAIQPFRLEPGKSVSYSLSWDQKDNARKRVPAGKYFAAGEITFIQGLRSPAKEIRIK